MASRRLRKTKRHKLHLQSCYLLAEIRASLRFTDDATLHDAHFNNIYVALHTKHVSKKGIVF